MKQNKIEWKEVEIGDILDYEQPGKYIVEGEILKHKTKNSVPVLTANKSFILGYTEEKGGIYDKSPVIIFDDFTIDSKFVDFKFKVKSSAMKLLTPKSKEVNLRFVFLMMKSINVNFSTHKRYYLSVYQKRSIPIPFLNGKPDIQEQERIVKILEEAEELTNKSKKAEELLDEYLRTLFYEMFYNKGFEEVELGDVAPLQGGYAFKSKDYKNKGVALVKITNVWKDRIIWEDKTFVPPEFLDEYSNFKLEESDLVLSMTRPIINSLESVKIAQVSKRDIPCLLNQRVGRFRINKDKINNKYLLYFCYSYKFKSEIEKYCSTSLQPNVSSNQVNKIKIPLPPLSLQEKFASIVEQIEKMKENINKTKQNSEELFNSLVSKAFGGNL